jgi:hypothetical protein
MIPTALGAAILILAGLWLFGGLLARGIGALLVFVGAIGIATTSDANGLLALGLGAILWLAGHWHYALRHEGFRSPLAQRLLSRFVPE